MAVRKQHKGTQGTKRTRKTSAASKRTPARKARTAATANKKTAPRKATARKKTRTPTKAATTTSRAATKKKRAAPRKTTQTHKKATTSKKAPRRTGRRFSDLMRRGPKPVSEQERSTYLENLLAQLVDDDYHATELKVEESKFDIGVPHDDGIREQETPHHYGLDRVVLLVIDPKFVFTYWEVTEEALGEAAQHIGPHAKLTLRFYDTTDGGAPGSCPSWDIEVFDRVGNWYLRLEHESQTLAIDIGLKDDAGRFCAVTRSNYMRTPRSSMAAPGPTTWMTVGPDGEKIITAVEEYTDEDRELLKRILGPYFYGLMVKGEFSSVVGSSMEAIFQDISQLKYPELMPSSSPSAWNAQHHKQ